MLFSSTTSIVSTSALRQRMYQQYRADEAGIVNELLNQAELGESARQRIWSRARDLVLKIRQMQQGKGGVDALLQEYALSTEEGVVLMCLAEALLRVPDKLTMDRLIRDKLAHGNWDNHLGSSDSVFVNASAWGLLLTGKVVNYADSDNSHQFGVLKRTLGRVGEPVIRSAVRYAMELMGTQFVLGKTIVAGIQRAEKQEARGYRYSYDMLGEGARTQADADRYFKSYMEAIEAIGSAAAGRGPEASPGISVKLSAIHPRYEFAHRDRVMAEMLPRLFELVLKAKEYDIGFTVDAEEADRLDISLDIIEAVACDARLGDWQGFGLAVQAYQKRAHTLVEWLYDMAGRAGRKLMVRLVKGAYWDSEIKWSQEEGLEEYPVFTRKPSTDVSYQACARSLLAKRDRIFPQFATHNAYTVATILEMDALGDYATGKDYEFQRLHGMGDSLYDLVLADTGVPCRVYAPIGEHSDLLAYLVRRLLENGANSSFVNNIVDEDIPVESLLDDPCDTVRHWLQVRNPGIPLPEGIYGSGRNNSHGLDLTDIPALEAMRQRMLAEIDKPRGGEDDSEVVFNPANRQELIGRYRFASRDDMLAAQATAREAFAGWNATAVSERAACLRRTADIMEDESAELMALCVKEAGKTIDDALAELREAVDFCRYYAQQLEDLPASASGRGLVLCISPWNFPLAIFTGQVVAALAAGNTVLAKPAEQTSLVAARAVEIMHRAGIPAAALQLINARGVDFGETLIASEDVDAVMFTGSTATAQWINRRLSERGREIPLIAETGGQNAMVVDSTALPEQVVDDVVSSAFKSAGQRCSALRVLFLQEDVADKIIDMIKGAMGELRIGDPALLQSDIGPVIDGRALRRLLDHSESMNKSDQARILYQCKLDESLPQGFYFAPQMIEIDSIDVLDEEIFGPVLHIVRYGADSVEKTIDSISATGYGLTMGIHSRINALADLICERVSVGNIYVNRNMTGAVVGVQPFGGSGLSGTGPKAGGPHYLPRLTQTGEAAAAAADGPAIPALREPLRTVYPLAWRQSGVGARSSIVRQYLGLCAQKESDCDDLIREVESRMREAQILCKPMDLPGPTGESNRLRSIPRGSLLALADTDSDWSAIRTGILTSLLMGNQVLLCVAESRSADAKAMLEQLQQAGLPQGLLEVYGIDRLGDALAADIGGIVLCETGFEAALRRHLGERDGAILPIIDARSDKAERYAFEQTITVDTTAAGGNASLMTAEQ